MRHLWSLVCFGEGRGMYGVELYAAVRLAVVDEGLSHHEAGRRFGIDRRTVKKMLRYASPPGYRRTKPVRRPKLDEFTGNETTTNLIGNGVLALLRNPGELERLRADPGLIPGAVEELLRFDSPSQATFRRALADCEVNGFPIPRRDNIVLLLGAANRDPDAFEAPDRLDVVGRGVAVLARVVGETRHEPVAHPHIALEFLFGQPLWTRRTGGLFCVKFDMLELVWKENRGRHHDEIEDDHVLCVSQICPGIDR